MSVVTGSIVMCAIISLGSIALVSFALWILSNDDQADRQDVHSGHCT